MGLFRRRDEETLNEQLLREAGLDRPRELPRQEPVDEPQPGEPPPGEPPPQPVGAFGDTSAARTARQGMLARPPESDALVTIHAPQVAGDTVEFATLPEGDIIVEHEQGDADLSPLAEAVERHVRPPYRATGRREAGDLWAVAAQRIDVRPVRCDAGDELELVCRGGALVLRVDRMPSERRIPELERIGAERGEEYVVEASRLDGDFWEIRAAVL